ncbi:uncharacterized protein K452DRAFT_314373 [Aplosporella prunicola CBS 121167]|uniref:Signal recognition particle subunit SRP14 n=1 Tax=Aplosporella prunicola CBS 121167 TaxID=1176127 RepID=A0A6A6BSR6_9PEZI|nr:uncharacterized protein K452DRAFT_314373 [Aplosporella prunicola CBS 121167]KAF2147159.1 hypothetical protein K452DRAFT_314373 [Aplosporella prunicola CBS 121167]
MADKHLSNDEFFARLKELFDVRREKDHGTVYLTQKRMTYDPATVGNASKPTAPSAPLTDLNPTEPLPVIIRATNGKSKEHRKEKVKLSTIVVPDALEGFYARYADTCKAGMSALKPRDRSRRKKDKQRKKNKAAAATA